MTPAKNKGLYELERAAVAKLMIETGYQDKFCCRIELLTLLEKHERAVIDLKTSEPQMRSSLRTTLRDLRFRIAALRAYQRTLYGAAK